MLLEEENFQGQVELRPILYIDSRNNCFLGCKMGAEELHTIKDMYELGKELAASDKLACFTENARPFAQFIYQEVKELMRYDSFKSMFDSQNRYSRQLHLSISGLRRFFDLKINQEVLCYIEQYGIPKEIVFTKEEPPIRLRLIEEKGYTNLSFNVSLKEVVLMDKAVDQYLFLNNTCYQLQKEFIRSVLPILKNAIYNGEETVTLSSNKVKDFSVYFREGTLDSYLAPTLLVKLYVEKLEDNKVTIKPMYEYGQYVINPLMVSGHSSEVVRDLEKEQQIETTLKAYHFEKSEDAVWALQGEGHLYSFLKDGIETLLGVAEVYISEDLKKLKIRPIGNVGMNIRLSDDLLGIELEAGEIEKETFLALLKAYRLKKKFFRLKSGDFISLEDAKLEAWDNILRQLEVEELELLEEEIQLPKYRALYLERLLQQNAVLTTTSNETYAQLIEAVNRPDKIIAPVPLALMPILRTYQKTGFNWLYMLATYGFGGVLADDMGLGKTIQMITLLSAESLDKPALVVCPTSLLLNWKKEFERFAPNLSTLLLNGTIKERKEKLATYSDYRVILTSYELLKRDIEQYKQISFSYCIIDEAQYIKNRTTKNAKSVKKVKATYRFALTGTPIENSLLELWSIFDFIMPGYLYNHKKFREMYEIPIIKEENKKAREQLKLMISPFLLRRMKKDVLTELPDKTETILYNKMEPLQEKLYKAYILQAKKKLVEELGEEKNTDRFKLLAMITRLRQICCHPSLCIENYDAGSGKFESCLELIENAVAGGHKILLFSQFTTMLDKLKDALIMKEISYSLLTGSIKAKDRMHLVEEFNKDDTSVFLISLKAGGVGINLTSADVVIHYDPWWNDSVQNQATDRAYRIGQKNKVQVFKLITKNTIEEKIVEMQMQKSKLLDSMLSTEQVFINQLSKEEILKLFD